MSLNQTKNHKPHRNEKPYHIKKTRKGPTFQRANNRATKS